MLNKKYLVSISIKSKKDYLENFVFESLSNYFLKFENKKMENVELVKTCFNLDTKNSKATIEALFYSIKDDEIEIILNKEIKFLVNSFNQFEDTKVELITKEIK